MTRQRSTRPTLRASSMLLTVALLASCTTERIVIAGDGGAPGAAATGAPPTTSTGSALPAECTPQPDSLTRDNCTGPYEQTLVSCPSGLDPAGCGRTTLPSSFCCPTPHMSADPEVQAFCAANRCNSYSRPSICELIVESNRHGSCAAKFEPFFQCARAPGVEACAANQAGAPCAKELEAFVVCAVKAREPSCTPDDTVACGAGTAFRCTASPSLISLCGNTINDNGTCCGVSLAF